MDKRSGQRVWGCGETPSARMVVAYARKMLREERMELLRGRVSGYMTCGEDPMDQGCSFGT